MSATMTPPATVDLPLDTTAQLPQDVAAPVRIRIGPDAPTRVPSHPSASTSRLSYGLFTATWISGLAVASVVASVVLLVAQPIVLAREIYGQRRYR